MMGISFGWSLSLWWKMREKNYYALIANVSVQTKYYPKVFVVLYSSTLDFMTKRYFEHLWEGFQNWPGQARSHPGFQIVKVDPDHCRIGTLVTKEEFECTTII
jgi:hypothetical protein